MSETIICAMTADSAMPPTAFTTQKMAAPIMYAVVPASKALLQADQHSFKGLVMPASDSHDCHVLPLGCLWPVAHRQNKAGNDGADVGVLNDGIAIVDAFQAERRIFERSGQDLRARIKSKCLTVRARRLD